ncbi:MmcB family DNA repair protein [Oleisolibacter albus]|uniref:MmcB family DNA repair protein n=1 Tax=Oleisolibacter albus TaxID=2171757 RepID=UPI000DF233A0|nr:MmcB family DNA repair protein [Oleisolibacter albus]
MLPDLPSLPRPASDVAAGITRGVRRMLADRAIRTLVEFPLANGRRADVLGLAEDGEIVIVEVKSGAVDFKTDHKWQDYLAFCDRFYFAVGPDFPLDLIPAACGLLVADAFGAETVRESPVDRLPAARRKAVILRAALAAAARLHRVEDPGRVPAGG